MKQGVGVTFEASVCATRATASSGVMRGGVIFHPYAAASGASVARMTVSICGGGVFPVPATTSPYLETLSVSQTLPLPYGDKAANVVKHSYLFRSYCEIDLITNSFEFQGILSTTLNNNSNCATQCLCLSEL
jgi:hypothetical protein